MTIRRRKYMEPTPLFLQGVYPFEGLGLEQPFRLAELSYSVPSDKLTQPIYFRGGNSSDELIYCVLMRDNKPMRYFPIGAKSGIHVPLAMVEDLFGDMYVSIFLAAPKNTAGFVVLDIGLMELEV